MGLFIEDETEDDYGCCALEEGHEGQCAYVCPDCHGSRLCWACGGSNPHDDFGSDCDECDGYGRCISCHDGLVDADG